MGQDVTWETRHPNLMLSDMITLVWSNGQKKVSRGATASQYLVIGRRDDCDIVLDDARVSRRHAIIYFEDGYFRLHNLSLTNPIVINGRWKLRCDQSVPIRPGDDFQIGDVKITIPVTEESPRSLTWSRHLRVRCLDCAHLVDYQLRDCPWCGASLADGESVIMPKRKKPEE